MHLKWPPGSHSIVYESFNWCFWETSTFQIRSSTDSYPQDILSSTNYHVIVCHKGLS